jgi:hypothetical protein
MFDHPSANISRLPGRFLSRRIGVSPLAWILLLAIPAVAAPRILRECGLEYLVAHGWKPGHPPVMGAHSPVQAAARAEATGISSLQTEHFMIWWATSGPHAIVGTQAKAVAAGDSVPGLVRAGATALENAWHLYVDTLGYLPPKSAGQGYVWGETAPSGKVPVEFCTIATVLNSTQYRYYGLTFPYQDGSSAMLLAADLEDFGGWSYTRDLDGRTQSENYTSDWNTVMRATASHEEFHAVQFNYDISLGHFLFEASAVTMEKVAVPQETDYLYFAAFELCPVSALTPLLSATYFSAYPHAWYVKQLMADLGDTILPALWRQRGASPNQPIEMTLRTVIGARGWSFDTTLTRYALRLGLTGRRYGWLSPGFSSFVEASLFPSLSETETDSSVPKPVPLDAGAIQEWIDTAGNTADRIVAWIPDAGANLAHTWKLGTTTGSERLRGSIRQGVSADTQSDSVSDTIGGPKVIRSVG